MESMVFWIENVGQKVLKALPLQKENWLVPATLKEPAPNLKSREDFYLHGFGASEISTSKRIMDHIRHHTPHRKSHVLGDLYGGVVLVFSFKGNTVSPQPEALDGEPPVDHGDDDLFVSGL